MIRFVIFSLFFLHVSSEELWYWKLQPKQIFTNVALEKNKPINLTTEGDQVKFQLLQGTLYSNSLSLLKVRDLVLEFDELENIEPGSLCSFSSLKRLYFQYLRSNFTIQKDTFNNCENLEDLALLGGYGRKYPVENNIIENLSKLTNLLLFSLKIEHLTRDFSKNLPLLESLTITSCSFETIDTDSFVDLKNLKSLELLNMPDLEENLQVYFGKLPKLEKLTVGDLNNTLSVDWLANLTLTEVNLKYNYLYGIEEGGICSSSSIKRVKIDFSKDQDVTLTKEAFKNCENLEKLVISGSYKNQIEIDAFQNMPNLKSLELGRLNISKIKRGYFKNLKNLESLHLDSLSIHEIDENTLEDLNNLKSLEISYNNDLQQIPEKLFKKLAKLETLLLVRNSIKNLTWDEFQGLSSLKTLNIKHNWIENLNAEKIAANMPSLNDFDYDENNIDCEKKKAFSEELQTKLGHPVTVHCKTLF